MAVNTHLNYGDFPSERAAEFVALLQWLTLRAKRQSRMYYENMILLGDYQGHDLDKSRKPVRSRPADHHAN